MTVWSTVNAFDKFTEPDTVVPSLTLPGTLTVNSDVSVSITVIAELADPTSELAVMVAT